MSAYPTALLRKISGLVDLELDDEAAIGALPLSISSVLQRRDILRRGEQSAFVHIILQGWAARYGIRADGSRRITGIMLPGDFCGIHAISGAAMDHSIVALTGCQVGRIEGAALTEVADTHPVINRALWRSKLLEESILREWLLNSTDAYQAVAHLLCELHARAYSVGLVEAGRCRIPLTQQDIGDCIGITTVHTNRVLQKLRKEGLMDFHRGDLFIPDIDALRRACDFTPAYLHPLEAA